MKKKKELTIEEIYNWTRRLAVAMNITKEDIRKWEKSNKPYKKLKKKSYLW